MVFAGHFISLENKNVHNSQSQFLVLKQPFLNTIMSVITTMQFCRI